MGHGKDILSLKKKKKQLKREHRTEAQFSLCSNNNKTACINHNLLYKVPNITKNNNITTP